MLDKLIFSLKPFNIETVFYDCGIYPLRCENTQLTET